MNDCATRLGAMLAPFVALMLLATAAAAAPIPTFEQLDKELFKYEKRAHLEGETHAHLEIDGLAFHCLFDLFLTVLNNPEHPKYTETRKAWDHNYDAFRKQAGLVAQFMGKNLFTLLITSSENYARGFKDGSKAYAPRFRPDDYMHPLPVNVRYGAKTDRVAWWHGAADADGDATANADELLAIAPDWRARGVTEDERACFIRAALGCESWQTRRRADAPANGREKEAARADAL